MYEAYSKNKYVSTGVIQWMLNNAWPSMIWHLYDYYLDTDAGYYATKKACEPLHIQYSYDDRSIVVVNSSYAPADGLHAKVRVHGMGWKDLYSAEASVSAIADSSQTVFELPDSLFTGVDKIFFIELSLADASGREVSRNFYWVPYTLTTFDWPRTDYTHTPAQRHEDLTALADLPKAEIKADATTEKTAHGRRVSVRLENPSQALAFQVRVAPRTADGGLVAPVLWSDNWIELAPGESVTLTADLPEGSPESTVIQVDGWNIAPLVLKPTSAVAHGGE
jgi:exo-1,4-beta-D-glucosaminidase